MRCKPRPPAHRTGSRTRPKAGRDLAATRDEATRTSPDRRPATGVQQPRDSPHRRPIAAAPAPTVSIVASPSRATFTMGWTQSVSASCARTCARGNTASSGACRGESRGDGIRARPFETKRDERRRLQAHAIARPCARVRWTARRTALLSSGRGGSPVPTPRASHFAHRPRENGPPRLSRTSTRRRPRYSTRPISALRTNRAHSSAATAGYVALFLIDPKPKSGERKNIPVRGLRPPHPPPRLLPDH